ncbi:MAG: hypothetical protein U1E96_04870 [Azonexus sp.]
MKRIGVLLGMPLTSLAQGQSVMTTPASFGVSESGVATYTIPIQASSR